LKKKDLAQ
jgi:hypothetical protein